MPLDAAWSNGETFDGAFFSSLVALANSNEAAVGTKQAADPDLTAIAVLTPANDDVLQRKVGAWTNRTMAQLKTDLALASTDIPGFAEVVQDTVAAMLVQGTGITLVYNDPSNTLTVNAVGSGSGDVSSNTSTSVAGEVVVFSGTTGKGVGRATGTGLAKLTSGVLGTATAGTDYLAPGATAAQVGLGNVDNVSDLNKPVSTAQAAAINLAAGRAIAIAMTFG